MLLADDHGGIGFIDREAWPAFLCKLEEDAKNEFGMGNKRMQQTPLRGATSN